MAVYTDVTDEELTAFLGSYDVGDLLSCKGIAEGVENTNYFLHTTQGAFILTLYEKRVDEADLPFFVGLMQHLSHKGLTCPQPVANRSGRALGHLSGRPAALVTFLEGLSLRRPHPRHCEEAGKALARLHLAGRDYPLRRPNTLSLQGWRPLVETGQPAATSLSPGLSGRLNDELAFLELAWPSGLPEGIIHADFFTDNVFFIGDRLSGVIDFYFACDDALAYDLAIVLNAWCFEPDGSFNLTKGSALIAGYESLRALKPMEVAVLPVLCRGAAFRFLLTRLNDWLEVPSGALVKRKDPLEYDRKLAFHRKIERAEDYGWRR